jgi:hypothetical protein
VRIKIAFLPLVAILAAGFMSTTPAGASTTVVKRDLGGHVQVDQFGTYYCFGTKATMVGTPGADVIDIVKPNSVVVTLGGNDWVLAYAAEDYGQRSLLTTANASTLKICTGDGNDAVFTGAGRIDTGADGDQVDTYDPEFAEFAPPFGSQIYTGPGDDSVSDDQETAYVHGGAGNDDLTGLVVYGDGGNDWLTGTHCFGGAGVDQQWGPDSNGHYSCDYFTQ